MSLNQLIRCQDEAHAKAMPRKVFRRLILNLILDLRQNRVFVDANPLNEVFDSRCYAHDSCFVLGRNRSFSERWPRRPIKAPCPCSVPPAAVSTATLGPMACARSVTKSI